MSDIDPNTAQTAARWLLGLRGVGGSRAAEIARQWSDPSALLQAAQACLESEWSTVFPGLPLVRPPIPSNPNQVPDKGESNLLHFWQDEYPARLRNLTDPPLLLYYSGQLDLLHHFSVAIVGTRNPTPYGEAMTRRLVTDLVERGVSIVSGHADGIDACAHHAAMRAGGATIAFLGGCHSQVRRQSPHLYQEIIKRGLLISEYDKGTEQKPWMYPARNRLIAAHSQGTVVIEGALKSGTMITARLCADLGRDLFAVPGQVGIPQAAGPNRLIREGAGLVTCVDDIMDAFYGTLHLSAHTSARVNLSASAVPSDHSQNVPSVAVDPQLNVLLGLFPESLVGAVTVDELCSRSQLSVGEILPQLTLLELTGAVESMPGNRYRIVATQG